MATKWGRGVLRSGWGKADKKFVEYIQLGGKTIGKKAAETLANAAAEFMANEDWDWPRGERYDTVYNGRSVRASGTYASGFRGGDAMHPWYSGNLHDSIAVGVFSGSRMLAARYMTPGAAEPQTYGGQDIDGVTEGQRVLSNYASRAAGGSVRAVMVIGVPYADYINTSPTIGWHNNTPNTHIGYADYLEHEFYTTLLPSIERLRKIKLRMK